MSAPPRLLIITADDFGLSAGVNEGIQLAHAAGGLTATTVLANGLTAEEAGELYARWPGLDVGLHVNLTLGRPVADPATVRSLVDAAGQLLSGRELMRRALRGNVRPDEVRREVEAQISRLRSLGVRLSHWDAHQQAAFWPGLVGPVAAATWDAGLRCARTPWVQPLDVHRSAAMARWRWRGGRPFRLGSDAHRRLAASRLGRRFALPDRQLSPNLVSGATELAERWECVLTLPPAGVSEAVSHPAVVDADLLRLAPNSGPARAIDLSVLSDKSLGARLNTRGITLIGFRDLSGPA